MDLTLQRDPSADGCTLGRLSKGGLFVAYTLEDIVRPVKVPGETAIPAGRYKVVITPSTRFGRLLPEIQDVPGFTGVRIHSGNVASDTAGCVLVGKGKAPGMVTQSRLALAQVQSLIASAQARHEPVWLTIQESADA